MSRIGGSASTEIEVAECVERDGAGNQLLVRMETEIRGPVVGILRGRMVDSMPGKLKAFVEGSA